jgi:hypothetical protein
VALRDLADQSFAASGSPAQPGHIGRGAGFIDEDQAFRIKLGLIVCISRNSI